MFYRKNQPLPLRPPAVSQARPNKPFPYILLCVSIFCIWLIYHSTRITLPARAEPPRIFSNPSSQDLRLTFIEAIRKSRSSIFLIMFGLSDPPILKALTEQAERGVPISGYYDSKGSSNLNKILKKCTIQPIRQTGLMHQKILVIDNETVFLGSANFTTPSLRMHDNLVVGLASRKVAGFLKERAPHQSGYLRVLVGGQDVEVWLLPDPRGHAITDLKRILRSAHRSLKVALFTLTHGALTDELIRAHKRGVEVTIVIDFHSALGASSGAVEKLKKNGVHVLFSKGVQLLHHKFVYADQSTLVCGSANWTKAAFTKNSDCLIALHNLTEQQRADMNQLWSRIQQNAQKM